jgi:hypothetical protein
MTELSSSELLGVIEILQRTGIMSGDEMAKLNEYLNDLIEEEVQKHEEAIELAKLIVGDSAKWHDMWDADREEYISYAMTAFKYFRDKGWTDPDTFNFTASNVTFTTKIKDVNADAVRAIVGDREFRA